MQNECSKISSPTAVSNDLKQRLQDKYSDDYGNKEQKEKNKKNQGNKNAQREQRRVELGWMDFNLKTRQNKQVRHQKGGGTRHLKVDKDVTLADILETGKNLFFPGGKSSRGKLSDFDVELKHFFPIHLGEHCTIEEAYVKTKVKMLRLYVCTRPTKCQDDSSDTEREITVVMYL